MCSDRGLTALERSHNSQGGRFHERSSQRYEDGSPLQVSAKNVTKGCWKTGKNIVGTHSIEELVKSLKKPRKIMMLVCWTSWPISNPRA